ncbi:hypothetical protein [Cereibacter changlensis]|uniref:hypothetical protein n=1 Tax=Cereibacter changlensis TaxID=402884 RepID=UPI001C63431B|nr:hypothetical protein [Cereibacter changlensis]
MRYRVFVGVAAAAVVISLPTLSAAYCSSPPSYSSSSFEQQVGKNLDYLLCLHNEQVVSLNSHARILNALDADMASLSASQSRSGNSAETMTLREVVMKYTAVSEENALLSARLSELEGRLNELELTSSLAGP